MTAYQGRALADEPRLLGSAFQRRMWLKKHFRQIPFRYPLLFLYNWLWLGSWRGGWVGYAWARLRADVMRLIDYKRREMEITGRYPIKRRYGPGQPDPRVPQYDLLPGRGGLCTVVCRDPRDQGNESEDVPRSDGAT